MKFQYSSQIYLLIAKVQSRSLILVIPRSLLGIFLFPGPIPLTTLTELTYIFAFAVCNLFWLFNLGMITFLLPSLPSILYNFSLALNLFFMYKLYNLIWWVPFEIMRLPLAETSSCLILRIFLFTDLFYFLLSFLHIYNQLPISFLHISYSWFFNQLLLTLRYASSLLFRIFFNHQTL